VDIYYFTYTGTSKKIANWLGEKFKITPKEIKTYSLPYFIWLFLSFIPYFPVKAFFDVPSNQTIIVGFPKWTFNCPPVTSFLQRVSFERLLLVITFGGWREIPYGEFYKDLASKKSSLVKVHYTKKSAWLENKNEQSGHSIELISNFFS